MLSWLTQSWCLEQHTKLEFRWETFFRIFLGLIIQRHFSLEMKCGPWGHEFPWTRLIQVLLKTFFKPEHRGKNCHNDLHSIIQEKNFLWTKIQNLYWTSRLSRKGNLEEIIMLSEIMKQYYFWSFPACRLIWEFSWFTVWQHSHLT